MSSYLCSTTVAKAPISNSFPLKYETGGGGGCATTCFEDTIGSPAKMATACDVIAIIAKTIIFFISVDAEYYISLYYCTACLTQYVRTHASLYLILDPGFGYSG